MATKQKNSMPLSEPQKAIADARTRFRVAVCGRRFGKTFLAMRELARFSRQPKSRCWFIAPTRAQGKGIVWQELKDRLHDLNWVAKTNESELKLSLVNGSEIQIMSADAYERTRGYSVDFIVYDEFADMDPDIWTATRPTLADREGSALFIGTPKGIHNWSKSIYDMHLDNDNWQSFQYTTIDGGRVSPEEIEAAKAEMDERLFQQEFLATWQDSGSRLFYSFGSDNISAYTGDTPAQLHIGFDMNIDPMSATVGVRTSQDDLHLIDEIQIFGSNTDEMVDEIKRRYRYLQPNRIWVFPDPAARQRKTSAGGRTDLSILQNAGFTVKCPNSHDSVRDGINSVNSRLRTADKRIHLLVDPKCKYTIQSLERHSYKPGTNQPDKTTGYDHMADALRYCVHYIWPVKSDTPIPPPQRWGHKIGNPT